MFLWVKEDITIEIRKYFKLDNKIEQVKTWNGT